jgi:hypothetical protein
MSRERKRNRDHRFFPLSTREQHQEFILENWDHLATAAWHGFQQMGRGYLDVFVDNAIKAAKDPDLNRIENLAMYFPLAALETHEANDPKIQEVTADLRALILKYDPETEIVIHFFWGAGQGERHSAYRLRSLPSPKDTLYVGDVGQIRVKM